MKVLKVPRLKIAVAEPAIPEPVATFDPLPPVMAQTAATDPPVPQVVSPSQSAAQTAVAPATPVKEVVRALDPRGNGDPDAVTCRVPQLLPGSRLPGPEVCETNRFWAALYAEGRRLGPDGLTLTATERFGEEGKLCSAPLLQAKAGLWTSDTVLAACR